jgi:hypothetical protein
MVYLTTVLIALIMKSQMIGWLVNNELERIMEKSICELIYGTSSLEVPRKLQKLCQNSQSLRADLNLLPEAEVIRTQLWHLGKITWYDGYDQLILVTWSLKCVW